MKLAAACAAMLLMTGCSLGSSIDALLAPPKLSDEQNDIYDALTKAVGKDIRLQYPKSGSYRSAFITENIDDEPNDEAVVFYENIGDESSDGSIRINILDTVDGKWRSVYDHAGVGTGIDRVIFTTLGSSGRKSIIIGYSMLSDEKTFKLYSYNNNILNTEYSDYYSSVFVSDMNKDGFDELVVIHPNLENNEKKAYMGLVTDTGSEVSEYTYVRMYDKSTDFVNIASGYVGKDIPAIYVDSLSGGQLFTEIFYCVNDTLRNPLYISASELIKDTARPSGYLSTDIDLDGIIEIPTLSYFPGYSQYSAEPFRLTEWNILENYIITRKYSSYYNVAEGYCFIIPNRWEGVVTAKKERGTNDIVFYKFRSDILNSTEELLRIAVVSDDKRDGRLADGYKMIKYKDNTTYLYKLPDNSNEPLILTETEVTNNFYMMT